LNLVNDLLGARHQFGKVEFGRFADQAIVGMPGGIAQEAGGAGQHAGGHAAVVGTGSAKLVALDQGNGDAEFAGAERGRDTRRAAADDDQIKLLG
jgi:hypothetical protein